MPAWLLPAAMGVGSLIGGLFGKKASNKQQKQNTQWADAETARWDSQFSPFMTSLQGQYGTATDRADKSYNDIYGRYTDMLGDNEAKDFFSNYSQTGGYNPADFNRLTSSIRSAGKNPVSAEGIARIRGNGVFDEMAKTGGYSDSDIRNVRSRTASQVPSFFGSLKDQLNRTNSIQGGFSPGYGAQTRALARDSARSGVEAVRDTEIGLQDSIRSGRMQGASSLSSAEQGLQSLLSQNLMQALGMESGLYSDQARNKLAGGQGLLSDSANKQNMLSGLTNLRSSTDGNQSMFLNALLQGYGLDASTRNNLLSMKLGQNPQGQSWDRFSQLLGALGPAAMTALGSGGSKPKSTGTNSGGFL